VALDGLLVPGFIGKKGAGIQALEVSDVIRFSNLIYVWFPFSTGGDWMPV
jgi:hypothetical protein